MKFKSVATSGNIAMRKLSANIRVVSVSEACECISSQLCYIILFYDIVSYEMLTTCSIWEINIIQELYKYEYKKYTMLGYG